MIDPSKRPSDLGAGVAVGQDEYASVLSRLRSVYQPIVDLATRRPVAFEALVRGPQGSRFEMPRELFQGAADLALESQLDAACQSAAMRGALESRLPASVPLFINSEPRWIRSAWSEDLERWRQRAQARLQVVIEITERALVQDPAGLLVAVRDIRARGWGIALDDVGANPDSLALMPFIDPDVIKLDLRLIQDHHRADVAAIVNAVIAQAERSGALILAEGIETPEHLDRALAMGAVLGQGWLFGRPSELPDHVVPLRQEWSFTRLVQEPPVSPFAAAKASCATRTASKELLLPMSHHLVRHAVRTREKPVLLAAFEHADHFTPGTAFRYLQLQRHCSFVGALGIEMTRRPVKGVRGASLSADDVLTGEWAVCVVGPHFAGALLAKDLGDQTPDRERRFEVAITYDRDLVLQAARSLMARIEPSDDS